MTVEDPKRDRESLDRAVEVGELRADLRRVEQRFTDFKEAHHREHEMLQAQVAEAREELWMKLGEMNEIRKQINEERSHFELREHAEAVINAITARQNSLDRGFTGLQGRLLGIGAAIGVVLLGIEIMFKTTGKP